MSSVVRPYSFADHPEHEAQLGAWANRWIAVANRVTAQTEDDKAAMRDAMRNLYGLATLAPPKNEVFCPSPIGAAVAATTAACVWWIRENKDRHRQVFGRRISEEELMATARRAVSIVTGGDEAEGRSTWSATEQAVATQVTEEMSAWLLDQYDGMAAEMETWPVTEWTAEQTEAAAERQDLGPTPDTLHVPTLPSVDHLRGVASRTNDPLSPSLRGRLPEVMRDAAITSMRRTLNAEVETSTGEAVRRAMNRTTEASWQQASEWQWNDLIEAAVGTHDGGQEQPIKFFLEAIGRSSRLQDPGNGGVSKCALYSFFRVVAEVPLPHFAQWIHYENAAVHGGYRYVHERFWIVSDFPTLVRQDEQRRLHSVTGPSVAWRDGSSQFYWHGTRVPREWIENPSTIDPKTALTHANVELRRCAAEIVGWDRILQEIQAVVVDEDRDPHVGQLVEVEIAGARERFLRVNCGTGRRFAIPVPPNVSTAIAAQSWIHDLPEATIRALEART